MIWIYRASLLVWTASLAMPAFAQTPTVTSASIQDEVLTISGAGFGTHGDYGGSEPFLNAAWNDFSDGINGGNLALDGTNNAAWTLQRSGGRTASKPWARKDWNRATDESIRRLGSLSLTMSGTTGEFYSAFWLRCGAKIVQDAKFWRIYGAGSGSTQNNVFLSITDGNNLMSFAGPGGTPPPATVWAVQSGRVQCASRWQRFEVYMRDTPGDDLIEVSMDGVLAFRRGSRLPNRRRGVEGSGANEREQWIVPWGGDGHTMDFGHMVDGDFFGYSDVFVDYTRARVELRNSPMCAASTQREVQIPLTWSNTTITARVNPGAFQNGQMAYVCVLDASGAVSPVGTPVVIAGK